jgi:hypothetical protein
MSAEQLREDFRKWDEIRKTMTPAERLVGIVGGIMAMGEGALDRWLAQSPPEERLEREAAMRTYAATATPEDKERIAQAVARAAMANVRSEPDMEAEKEVAP